METLRLGDKGESVTTLQITLQKHGYELLVDGIFGENTEDIVRDFQNNKGLTPDGVVGRMTWGVLLESSNSSKINKTKYILPTKNYYQEKQSKKQIILHHTNGHVVIKGSKRPSMNHFHWWKSRDLHVSTAYSIDYVGNIYEHFDPSYWAFHTGLGGKFVHLDKMSIGIELTNEGGMTKHGDDYKWYSNDVPITYARTWDEPVALEKPYRGFSYYAPYSKEQMESTIYLVKYLTNRFNIINNIIDDFEYHPELLTSKFEGIYSHVNIRQYNPKSDRNKWDLSPAFDMNYFKSNILS